MTEEKRNICWRCGYTLSTAGYEYDSICPGCRTPTRVCRNCRYFSSGAPKQCTQPVADKIADKQRANSCHYFEGL